MIAVPARGRRRDRPRLAAVPVLRPQGAEARRSRSTTTQAGSSRRRPAAASAARRSTRRSSPSTPRCSRCKAERPVRMIYDRHEDIAATTKRHPAIVRHRTGVTQRRRARRPGHRGPHGRRRVLHAHARSSCRAARSTPAARIAAPNVRIRGARDGDEHAAQRRVPRLRRAADRVRGRDAGQPRRRGARHVAARAAAPRTSTGRATRRRPARCCATSVAGDRGPRAGRRGSRLRARPRTDAATAAPSAGSGTIRPARRPASRRHGIGLALAWHGAGFTGSGEVQMRLGRVASSCTADGRIRVLTA